MYIQYLQLHAVDGFHHKYQGTFSYQQSTMINLNGTYTKGAVT